MAQTAGVLYADGLDHESWLRAEAARAVRGKLDFTAGRGDLRPEIHGLHHIAKTLRATAKKQGITHF